MTSGTIIFVVLVLGVAVLGFLAARWGRANLSSLDEWALGGRRFGTIVSWFLLGGDLYTAYTFIAVPALAFGAGALAFFAVPYTTIAYPLAFLIMARFWTIAKRRGYVTTADFVHDRFGSRPLELAVAVTGVLATMPYIALQLIGVQVILERSGIAPTHGSAVLMLVIAFVLLAAYTFTSGLRAPAMIAFVKDTLIYLTVIVAIIVIPRSLGGWGHVFALAQAALAANPKPGSTILSPNLYFAYSSLALGSALALFIYPHSITSVLSARSANVIRRNCALLPLYSILLTLIALLGYCALAAQIRLTNANFAIPDLFARFFPNWFAGVAFAAIVIGALVPAAIMAIGAANLFASNILQTFQTRQTRPPIETNIARILALFVLAGGLAIALLIKPLNAIEFQLLGGAWIVQIFPAVILALYTRWFHRNALLVGWAVGLAAAAWMAYATGFATTIFPLHIGTFTLPGYIAFYALLLNLAVTAAFTALFNALKTDRGADLTTAADYA
ncbi:MAG TPA: sodium:solute symporter family protein [Candidatus Rubrimentiphilum sp.]|nr:sodium:solute symporter family protein [Candidatus Rubrimentiphilum sp.]